MDEDCPYRAKLVPPAPALQKNLTFIGLLSANSCQAMLIEFLKRPQDNAILVPPMAKPIDMLSRNVPIPFVWNRQNTNPQGLICIQ
jgi:hypothetical protein